MNAQRSTDHSHKGQKRERMRKGIQIIWIKVKRKEWMKKNADHLHQVRKRE